MKKELLDILCCPECDGEFGIANSTADNDEVFSGSLSCLKCGAEYPILDGLPHIITNIGQMAKTAESFGKQWSLHNAGHFEKDKIYNQTREQEAEAFMTTFDILEPSALSGKHILDAGCGSGRLIESIARGSPDSTIVGFDISDAARIAFQRCKELKNVHIIQCNLLNPPLRAGSFDYVWCEGVLHHTPDGFQSFAMLDNLVSKNGRLYLWVYPKYKFSPFRFVRDVLWKPYVLPPMLIYILSWLLAVPLYCFLKVLQVVRFLKRGWSIRSIAFGFFDNLSPEFQHRYSKAEVRNWFVLHKYEEVKFISDIGVVGKK